LDTRIFVYNFVTSTGKDLSNDKLAGIIDLNLKFSPNEAKIIFVNTSNDGLLLKSIYKMDLDFTRTTNNRTLLFLNAMMPDWE
jgi:Tol biopolymer transport system component